LAWLAWVQTILDTSLAASGVNLVCKGIGGVEHFQSQITVTEQPWLHHLAEIGSLAAFDVGDVDDRSVEAVESACAWSFDLEECLVVGFLIGVSELHGEHKGSAGTSEALSSTEVGLFSGSEELNTGLFGGLVHVVDEVAVLSFAATADFCDVDLLLDVDTFFASESVIAGEGLGWSWGIELLLWVLLLRVLLLRVLLLRVLLLRVLLWVLLWVLLLGMVRLHELRVRMCL